MTDHGRRSWTAALQEGQRRRDAFIRQDWRRTIDWAQLGRPIPPERVSKEEVARATGSTQSPPGSEAANGTTSLKSHAIIPEYFPAGHVGFLMDVLTHPQMLRLHRTLLGSEHILLDHNSLLNRAPGYVGGPFHSHAMTSMNWRALGEMDSGRVPAGGPAEYDSQPNFIISLCYPEGFEAEEDGGLQLIPGSVGAWRLHCNPEI